MKKKKNSLQYNDNINNNLTFVLDTIFEPGQTLYLGGKSFTILFYNLKINKPRITNKIGTITADPNQTIYDTRKKLRKKGKENKNLPPIASANAKIIDIIKIKNLTDFVSFFEDAFAINLSNK